MKRNDTGKKQWVLSEKSNVSFKPCWAHNHLSFQICHFSTTCLILWRPQTGNLLLSDPDLKLKYESDLTSYELVEVHLSVRNAGTL